MPRPRIKIDKEQVEKCAEKQWTNREIAAFFRVNEVTLWRRYAKEIDDARQRGLTKLRDLQWKRALEGSDRMIEHMSKHYLGQHDRQKVDITNVPDETLAKEAERRLNDTTTKKDS